MNGSLDPIKENIYEQELESLKNAFFSNIYHEFMKGKVLTLICQGI